MSLEGDIKQRFLKTSTLYRPGQILHAFGTPGALLTTGTALASTLVQTSAVLPKLFSTATQFLERQSIATRIALLDKKKVVLKRKKKIFVFTIEYNFTKKNRCISHNEACVVGGLVSGYCS
jgi:hypothetical protein